MSFWNLPKLDPTRKFRFQISSAGVHDSLGGTAGGVWVNAKSIDKPTYEINSGEYQIGNHKVKYPGIVAWNDITITVVDTGFKTSDLMDNLRALGYSPVFGGTGLEKHEKTGKSICRVIIMQLDAEGSLLETWTLENAFFKSVNFGSLAYADDEMVEIQITVTYDYASFVEGEDIFGFSGL